MADTNGWWYDEGRVEGKTVFEKEEIQLTKLLGPDGEPYAIRRPKTKLGFDLTPTKDKSR